MTLNSNIEAMDVLIGIDQRGVAHVLKHRTRPLDQVNVEVKLTLAYSETFTSETKDTGLLDPDPTYTAQRARVAVDAAAIRALLIEAAGIEGQWVEISGRKVDNAQYKRRVKPISVGQRNGTFIGDTTEYLYCHVTGGETRTYRLDGIERAEFLDIVRGFRP